MFHEWKPYVSAAERRKKAERHVATLKKKGHPVAPVVIDGQQIAKTFWGKAWCQNLESYGDYASRLPRGRTYVRNGSVVDLQIEPGAVSAWVSGTDLYRVSVKTMSVTKPRWSKLVSDCAGEIDSLVELLQGRMSQAVMQRMCQQRTGLFPEPAEIGYSCTCPDWALMCKHVAAVLYGVGARLDERPELLFTLRAVNEQELIAKAGKKIRGASRTPKSEKVLDSSKLADVFDLDFAEMPRRKAARGRVQQALRKGTKKKSTKRARERAR